MSHHETKFEVYRFNGRDFWLFDYQGSQTAQMTLSDFEKIDLPEMEDPRVIIDLGANIGVFSFCMADKYPKAKVIAYEPVEINFNHLQLGIEANRLPHIEPIPMAVSLSKEITLYQDIGNSGAASSTSLSLFKKYGGHYTETVVPCVTLKEVLAPYERVDLLKIDIEGEEYNLTQDWSELDKVDRLFIEVHTIIEDPNYRDMAIRTIQQIRERMKNKFLLMKIGDEELAKELERP